MSRRLGLAPVILGQLSKAIERLRQERSLTLLLAEQNVTFALPHSDRVYVLDHGRITWHGDPARFAAGNEHRIFVIRRHASKRRTAEAHPLAFVRAWRHPSAA